MHRLRTPDHDREEAVREKCQRDHVAL
jgi:hypothetical protein